MTKPSADPDYAGQRFWLIWFCDEFPDDQERRIFETVHNFSKDKRFQHLARFLDNVLTVLREEIARLDSKTRRFVPVNILDVVNHKGANQSCCGGCMQHFLLIVLHIALFIGKQEQEPPRMRRWPSLLVGLSAGMLSAAALAATTTLDELAIVGAESARVAFRIGIHVQKMSCLLEAIGGHEQMPSWAYVVTTLDIIDVQTEVDAFNRATSNEGLTRLYISSAHEMSVTVTGPPSRLSRLFETSPKLRNAKWAPLPIYDGLAHAPHLYDANTVAQILQPLCGHPHLANEVSVPMLSSETGKIFRADTGLELLAQVTLTILTKPVHFDVVRAAVLGQVLRQRVSEFSRFLPCRASCEIIEALEARQPSGSLIQHDLMAWTRVPHKVDHPRTEERSKLAVVGMSCRLPGSSDSPQSFWQTLINGQNTCCEVPRDRFDIDKHYDPTGKIANSTRVRYGNFVDEPGRFDAAFFNMSPREADNTDPAARLALVCTYEALEMAGYTPNRTRSTMHDRVGTYLGQASDDWRELNASQNINAFIVPGGVRAFANGRINYFFRFGGPSFNIDTACSSGLAAVQMACSALWAGEVDTAIAGGCNIITDPDNYCGLDAAGFLSRTGQCKVWDETADGYCRADGVGIVVIKRLEDAETDNDNIIAVILSGATNHSAFAPSITHPHAGAQIANYSRVMNDAGIDPLDVTYAELHGTGTQAGDVVEAQSIQTVFAPLRPRRKPNQKLYLGAVKSNIGHGEAAAGIASMIKALLCFQHQTIPPHIGIRTRINPNISTDLLLSQGAVLSHVETYWPRPNGGRRLAVVNSFGAHGGNTTLLLEEAPAIAARKGVDPRSVYPIIVSAKSSQSLRKNLQRLKHHLDENPNILLGDLSYTLCARRIHHNYRIGTTCSSTSDVSAWLSASLAGPDIPGPSPARDHQIMFAFTGQGSFYPGMATQLLKDSSVFRSEVARLNQIVLALGYPPVLMNINCQPISDEDASPITCQLTIVVVELALVALLAKLNIKPTLVFGHSLGEYAALVASGVLSAADAIMLVVRRGRMLQEKCAIGSSGMLKISSAGPSSTEKFVHDTVNGDDDLEFVCINSTKSWVIGGTLDSLRRTQLVFERQGFVCTTMKVPFAFHTSQMDPIMDELGTILDTVSLKRPLVQFLSPILQRTVREAGVIDAEYLKRACREIVNSKGAVAAALAEGILDANTLICEIGPHPIVTRYIQESIPEARVFPMLSRTEENWATLTRAIVRIHCAGVPVNWAQHFVDQERAHRLCQLPSYSWNDHIHWIPYNGTWTLDKANPHQHGSADRSKDVQHILRSSLIHEILEEDIGEYKARMVLLSDFTNPDVRKVMDGHVVNKHGLASWAVYYEMAVAVGSYIFERLGCTCHEQQQITVFDLQCFVPQLLAKQKGQRQLTRLEVQMEPDTRVLHLKWYSYLSRDSRPKEPCTIGMVMLDERRERHIVSATMEHLVASRVAALDQDVLTGAASKICKDMVYRIFENIVDYGPEYKGIECAVTSGYEAYVDVRLSAVPSGQWYNPPCWIDSLCQVAGFVMNGGVHCDFRNDFWVTPGFDTFKLKESLQQGASYCSYVKMALTEDPRVFAGDVFIMREGRVIGMVEQVKFRRFPRVLMDEFFSLPSDHPRIKRSDHTQVPADMAQENRGQHGKSPQDSGLGDRTSGSSEAWKEARSLHPIKLSTMTAKDAAPPSSRSSSGVTPIAKSWAVESCQQLLLAETGLGHTDLDDESILADIGVDSMVALVLATKLRDKTGLDVKHSVFLEHQTIGQLNNWLASNL